MADLSQRVDAVEAAVLALATIELGDVTGHQFHGNQYTYLASYAEDHEAMRRGEYKDKKVRVQASDEPTANLIAAQMVGRHGIPVATKLLAVDRG